MNIARFLVLGCLGVATVEAQTTTMATAPPPSTAGPISPSTETPEPPTGSPGPTTETPTLAPAGGSSAGPPPTAPTTAMTTTPPPPTFSGECTGACYWIDIKLVSGTLTRNGGTALSTEEAALFAGIINTTLSDSSYVFWYNGYNTIAERADPIRNEVRYVICEQTPGAGVPDGYPCICGWTFATDACIRMVRTDGNYPNAVSACAEYGGTVLSHYKGLMSNVSALDRLKPRCLNGWTTIYDSSLPEPQCYKVITGKQMTWQDAERYCQSEDGSHLATFTDTASNDGFKAFTELYCRSNPNGTWPLPGTYWIGFNDYAAPDNVVQADWTFPVDAARNASIMNWTGPVTGDKYCESWTPKDVGHREPCDTKHEFICQRDVLPRQPACPTGWLSLGSNCYILTPQTQSKDDGVASCENLGPGVQMATFHSQVVWDQFLRYYMATINLELNATLESIYLGLACTGVPVLQSACQPTDGTTQNWGYWDTTDPGTTGGLCVAADRAAMNMYHWKLSDCNIPRATVCQLNQTISPKFPCNPGWTEVGSRCFYFPPEQTKSTWRDAERACHELGGVLPDYSYKGRSLYWNITDNTPEWHGFLEYVNGLPLQMNDVWMGWSSYADGGNGYVANSVVKGEGWELGPYFADSSKYNSKQNNFVLAQITSAQWNDWVVADLETKANYVCQQLPNSTCPDAVKYYQAPKDKMCYYSPNDTTKNFAAVDQECLANGGQMTNADWTTIESFTLVRKVFINLGLPPDTWFGYLRGFIMEDPYAPKNYLNAHAGQIEQNIPTVGWPNWVSAMQDKRDGNTYCMYLNNSGGVDIYGDDDCTVGHGYICKVYPTPLPINTWELFRGSISYMVLQNGTKFTYADAVSACTAAGGQMPSFHTPTEYDDYQRYRWTLRDTGYPQYMTDLWLGLCRSASSIYWTYSTFLQDNYNWALWAPGNPTKGAVDQCAYSAVDNDFMTWHSDSQANSHSVICQKRDKPLTSMCDQPGFFHLWQGRCFIPIMNYTKPGLTRQEAADVCESNGWTLPSFRDNSQWTMLLEFIIHTNKYSDRWSTADTVWPMGNFWIGLTLSTSAWDDVPTNPYTESVFNWNVPGADPALCMQAEIDSNTTIASLPTAKACGTTVTTLLCQNQPPRTTTTSTTTTTIATTTASTTSTMASTSSATVSSTSVVSTSTTPPDTTTPKSTVSSSSASSSSSTSSEPTSTYSTAIQTTSMTSTTMQPSTSSTAAVTKSMTSETSTTVSITDEPSTSTVATSTEASSASTSVATSAASSSSTTEATSTAQTTLTSTIETSAAESTTSAATTAPVTSTTTVTSAKTTAEEMTTMVETTPVQTSPSTIATTSELTKISSTFAQTTAKGTSASTTSTSTESSTRTSEETSAPATSTAPSTTAEITTKQETTSDSPSFSSASVVLSSFTSGSSSSVESSTVRASTFESTSKFGTTTASAEPTSAITSTKISSNPTSEYSSTSSSKMTTNPSTTEVSSTTSKTSKISTSASRESTSASTSAVASSISSPASPSSSQFTSVAGSSSTSASSDSPSTTESIASTSDDTAASTSGRASSTSPASASATSDTVSTPIATSSTATNDATSSTPARAADSSSTTSASALQTSAASSPISSSSTSEGPSSSSSSSTEDFIATAPMEPPASPQVSTSSQSSTSSSSNRTTSRSSTLSTSGVQISTEEPTEEPVEMWIDEETISTAEASTELQIFDISTLAVTETDQDEDTTKAPISSSVSPSTIATVALPDSTIVTTSSSTIGPTRAESTAPGYSSSVTDHSSELWSIDTLQPSRSTRGKTAGTTADLQPSISSIIESVVVTTSVSADVPRQASTTSRTSPTEYTTKSSSISITPLAQQTETTQQQPTPPTPLPLTSITSRSKQTRQMTPGHPFTDDFNYYEEDPVQMAFDEDTSTMSAKTSGAIADRRSIAPTSATSPVVVAVEMPSTSTEAGPSTSTAADKISSIRMVTSPWSAATGGSSSGSSNPSIASTASSIDQSSSAPMASSSPNGDSTRRNIATAVSTATPSMESVEYYPVDAYNETSEDTPASASSQPTQSSQSSTVSSEKSSQVSSKSSPLVTANASISDSSSSALVIVTKEVSTVESPSISSGVIVRVSTAPSMELSSQERSTSILSNAFSNGTDSATARSSPASSTYSAFESSPSASSSTNAQSVIASPSTQSLTSVRGASTNGVIGYSTKAGNEKHMTSSSTGISAAKEADSTSIAISTAEPSKTSGSSTSTKQSSAATLTDSSQIPSEATSSKDASVSISTTPDLPASASLSPDASTSSTPQSSTTGQTEGTKSVSKESSTWLITVLRPDPSQSLFTTDSSLPASNSMFSPSEASSASARATIGISAISNSQSPASLASAEASSTNPSTNITNTTNGVSISPTISSQPTSMVPKEAPNTDAPATVATKPPGTIDNGPITSATVQESGTTSDSALQPSQVPNAAPSPSLQLDSGIQPSQQSTQASQPTQTPAAVDTPAGTPFSSSEASQSEEAASTPQKLRNRMKSTAPSSYGTDPPPVVSPDGTRPPEPSAPPPQNMETATDQQPASQSNSPSAEPQQSPMPESKAPQPIDSSVDSPPPTDKSVQNDASPVTDPSSSKAQSQDSTPTEFKDTQSGATATPSNSSSFTSDSKPDAPTSASTDTPPGPDIKKIVDTTMMSLGCSMLIGFTSAALLLFIVTKQFSVEAIIHINEELALIGAHILVLCLRDRTENFTVCAATGIGLQFFYTASFSFMALESLQTYAVLTSVIGSGGFFGRAINTAIGWIPAAVITSVSAASKYSAYPAEKSCWLNLGNDIFFASVLPITGAGVLAVVLTEAALTTHHKRLPFADQHQRHAAKVNLHSMLALFPLGTCSWLFGLLATYYNNTYLYGVVFALNVSIGVTTFVFHSMGSPEIYAYLKKLWAKVSCKTPSPN